MYLISLLKRQKVIFNFEILNISSIITVYSRNTLIILYIINITHHYKYILNSILWCTLWGMEFYMKKGFTLIETIVVIIVLSIIALIAVPKISTLVKDVNKDIFKTSVGDTLNSVDYYLSGTDTPSKFPTEGIMVKDMPVKNKQQFISGYIVKNSDNKYEAVTISNGKYCASGTLDDLRIDTECYKLDTTAPLIDETKVVFTTTTSSINITLPPESLIEKESAISKYTYEIIKDSYYKKIESNLPNCSFTGLKDGTTYTIKIVATNQNNLSSDVKIINVTTSTLDIPVYSISPSSGYATSKIVTVTYPIRQKGFVYDYSLNGGTTWTVVSSGTTVNKTFTANGSIIARITDGVNYKTASSYTVTGIDTSVPTVTLTKTGVTTNTISVSATAADSESGITKYEFAIDSGSYVSNGTTVTYTYTGVTTGTHTLKVRVTNGSGLTTETSISATTNDITVPTYSINPASGWATSKTVTITYPTRQAGFIYTYSVDGGTSWTTVSSGTTATYVFNSNGTIIARIYDGTNYKTASSYTVSGIDGTAPTVTLAKTSATTNTISVTATAADSESGITKYEFAIDSGSYINNNTTSTYTYTGVVTGTHTLKVRVTNGSSLTTENSISTNPNDITVPTYSINPASGWATSKTVTITYPTRQTGFIYTYSVDGGASWTTVSSGTTAAVTFTANGSIIARIYDGTNYKTASSYTVSGIDTTPPVISGDASDQVSGYGANVALPEAFLTASAASGISSFSCINTATGSSITNISQLLPRLNPYPITCTATSTMGLTSTVTKNIRIPIMWYTNPTRNGYRIYIYDPSPVYPYGWTFPTWSLYNGQDDLTWQQDAVSAGNGFYYYDVNVAFHNNECGEYATHVYYVDSAQQL
jgi:prepilin-type N-terminal cleavage/methylation domain-containing protein